MRNLIYCCIQLFNLLSQLLALFLHKKLLCIWAIYRQNTKKFMRNWMYFYKVRTLQQVLTLSMNWIEGPIYIYMKKHEPKYDKKIDRQAKRTKTVKKLIKQGLHNSLYVYMSRSITSITFSSSYMNLGNFFISSFLSGPTSTLLIYKTWKAVHFSIFHYRIKESNNGSII